MRRFQVSEKPTMLLDLTVIILTKNEAIHLARALANVNAFAGRVVVVDSFSTDATVQIAHAHGADVLQNKFVNYAKQFQWALDHANISTSWVMRLDADELIESDLQAELLRSLPILGSDVVGINLKRKHIFMGRWVKHGGRYPLVLLRIWRHGQGRIEDRWMDEHMVVWGGRSITMEGGFADHNLNDLTFFTTKHNGYATREALDVLIQKRRLAPRDEVLNAKSASLQASFKRLAKEQVYNRLPFTVSALAYFLWRYIFQLGFLDGRSGLVYHFLQGYWYRFLVGAKLMELEQALVGVTEPDGVRVRLLELTGHDIGARA